MLFRSGENVASAMEYDREKVMRTLDQAGAGQWARELPKGLEQPLYLVEKDGINISGGEAQKIAIARALYKDSPFVIYGRAHGGSGPACGGGNL